jgi:AcrR family transcriptional regulator
MAEIAVSADLSVGTLYNYFPSKSELLLALIADSDERYLVEGWRMVDAPPRKPIVALADIMILATDHCVRQIGKSIWRQVSATAVTNAASTFGRQYAVTTQKHEDLVVAMMHALQKRGDIRQDVNAAKAAHYVFSMKSKLFVNFVSDDDMTLAQHGREVYEGVGFYLDGLLEARR